MNDEYFLNQLFPTGVPQEFNNSKKFIDLSSLLPIVKGGDVKKKKQEEKQKQKIKYLLHLYEGSNRQVGILQYSLTVKSECKPLNSLTDKDIEYYTAGFTDKEIEDNFSEVKFGDLIEYLDYIKCLTPADEIKSTILEYWLIENKNTSIGKDSVYEWLTYYGKSNLSNILKNIESYNKQLTEFVEKANKRVFANKVTEKTVNEIKSIEEKARQLFTIVENFKNEDETKLKEKIIKEYTPLIKEIKEKYVYIQISYLLGQAKYSKLENKNENEIKKFFDDACELYVKKNI